MLCAAAAIACALRARVAASSAAICFGESSRKTATTSRSNVSLPPTLASSALRSMSGEAVFGGVAADISDCPLGGGAVAPRDPSSAASSRQSGEETRSMVASSSAGRSGFER